MSPTNFKESGLRFFFFSREDWIDPRIEVARNHCFNDKMLRAALASDPGTKR